MPAGRVCHRVIEVASAARTKRNCSTGCSPANPVEYAHAQRDLELSVEFASVDNLSGDD